MSKRLYESIADIAKGAPLRRLRRVCDDQKAIVTSRLTYMLDEAGDLLKLHAQTIRDSHEAARAADKARIAELEAALSRAAAWIEKLPVPTKGACAQLARIDAALAQQDSEWQENDHLSPELAAAIAAREEAISLVHNLKQQAQAHAQEARTANGTLAEIYQIVTGATGEPGNWNGAEPVRKRIADLEGLAREIVKQYPNPNLTHEQFRVHACKHAEAVVGQRDTGCTLECGAYGAYCRCAADRAAQQGKEGE